MTGFLNIVLQQRVHVFAWQQWRVHWRCDLVLGKTCSRKFPSGESLPVAKTTIWNEEVRWRELQASVKGLTEDSRQAYMTALSRQRLVGHNEQGDAIGEKMCHDVDFFRRVFRQRRKLGALTMTYVCTHCSTGHNVREKKARKEAFRMVEWWRDNHICGDADRRLGRRTRRSGGETTRSGINDCHHSSRLE